MRLNVRSPNYETTYEGAPAARMTQEQALRRSVMSCLLWEQEFYEDGMTIADRIVQLSRSLPANKVAAIAIEARSVQNLRHVPLLITAALASQGGPLVSETIAKVIQRADELTEFLAIYAMLNGVTPDKVKPKLSNQVRKGLAMAFGKFNAYALAKYNRDGAIKLRDVLFLSHPKPKDEEQAALWSKLIDGTLPAPDTWEVALSGGADKREAFERLLREGKLAYLALLRNLRNMTDAGVDRDLIVSAILARKGGAEKVLPFRYVAAARACPQLEPALDQALSEAISELPPFSGKTIVLVDVSDSMNAKLSAKSDLKRMDAAATLASMIHGQLRVFTFSDQIVEVPPRRGMAGVDAIIKSQKHSGTYLDQAIDLINKDPHDRLIVITDEQAQSRVRAPVAKLAYMVNVASAKNGVGYGRWTHIDGFSENILRYIHEYESAGSR